jgi:hypothetical protein
MKTFDSRGDKAFPQVAMLDNVSFRQPLAQLGLYGFVLLCQNIGSGTVWSGCT